MTKIVELRQHYLNHKINQLYSTTIDGSSNGQEVLIFISQVSTPESLNRLANALYSVVEAEETIIFDTIPSTSYLAGERFPVPTVRRLCTSSAHSSTTDLPPFLESPVLIEGVTAAIVQHCQLRKQKAIVYISLEDNMFLESPTIIAWESCLKHHIPIPTSSTSYNTLLKKVVSHRPNSLFA
jgi:hypothetical protein